MLGEVHERLDVTYHNEAVPQTALRHQMRCNRRWRFFPEAAYFAHGSRQGTLYRDARLYPAVLDFRGFGRNTQKNDRLGSVCDRSKSGFDMANKSGIIGKMVIGWEASHNGLRVHLADTQHCV